MLKNIMKELLCIMGPTATGKTKLAVHVAGRLDGEIISADSRQVYRGMDIGTGKDIEEYSIPDKPIKYHLIDIADAGYEFNLFEYQQEFLKVYYQIKAAGKLPVLCGGTGLYIESVVNGYDLIEVPENEEFRESIKDKTDSELVDMLVNIRDAHNTTDTIVRERMIRALEIDMFKHGRTNEFPEIDSLLFCMQIEKSLLHKRIKDRLQQRLEEGMVEEVQDLMDRGVPEEMLYNYGLEYRFILNYLRGTISLDEMTENLYIAIRQFAKKQQKWFRRMERNGAHIHWLNAEKDLETLADEIFFTWKSCCDTL
jgi:tRNA dimethylallyltransferase